jgi:hypothetical protein
VKDKNTIEKEQTDLKTWMSRMKKGGPWVILPDYQA